MIVRRSHLQKRHAAQRLAQMTIRSPGDDDVEACGEFRLAGQAGLQFGLDRIPGIGEITAIAMLIDMPALGTPDSKQVASLAGLAPIAPRQRAASRQA